MALQLASIDPDDVAGPGIAPKHLPADGKPRYGVNPSIGIDFYSAQLNSQFTIYMDINWRD